MSDNSIGIVFAQGLSPSGLFSILGAKCQVLGLNPQAHLSTPLVINDELMTRRNCELNRNNNNTEHNTNTIKRNNMLLTPLYVYTTQRVADAEIDTQRPNRPL